MTIKAITPSSCIAAAAPPHEAMSAILRAVDSLEWQIGRVKLARLLKGRIAHDMIAQGYTDNPYHGTLAEYSLAEIDAFIRWLVEDRYLLAAKGARPLLRVTLEGAKALLQAS